MSSIDIYRPSCKYSRVYLSLVEKRKALPYDGSYSETHHIIPRSLGGSNHHSNLVTLSAREHLVAHLLLEKMTRGIPGDWEKMAKAAWCMVGYISKNQNRIKVSSRLYDRIKKMSSIASAERMLGATMITDGQTFAYLAKGDTMPNGWWAEGKQKKDSCRDKMSKTRKSLHQITDGFETRWVPKTLPLPDGWRMGHKGHSAETKIAQSAAAKKRYHKSFVANNKEYNYYQDAYTELGINNVLLHRLLDGMVIPEYLLTNYPKLFTEHDLGKQSNSLGWFRT